MWVRCKQEKTKNKHIQAYEAKLQRLSILQDEGETLIGEARLAAKPCNTCFPEPTWKPWNLIPLMETTSIWTRQEPCWTDSFLSGVFDLQHTDWAAASLSALRVQRTIKSRQLRHGKGSMRQARHLQLWAARVGNWLWLEPLQRSMRGFYSYKTSRMKLLICLGAEWCRSSEVLPYSRKLGEGAVDPKVSNVPGSILIFFARHFFIVH